MVMSCNRLGCNNIMCDINVSGIGYICYECKDEFILRNTNKHESYSEAIKALDEFMYERKTPSGYVESDKFDINQLFE